MNTKTKKILLSALVIFVFSVFPAIVFAGPFDYTPMEKIPGFNVSGSFPDYILAIYKFGIWAVGIAALFMIMIGGFMYITSAGNNASMEKAKGIIFDAVTGVLLALIAFLLLYVINPELVNIKLISGSINTGSGSSNSGSGSGSSSGSGTGKCTPVTSGPCSVEKLKTTCFGDNAVKASSICNAESGGSEKISSGVDKCQPGGESVSWGLFQINISANNISGYTCANSAASPTYTGKNKNCTTKANYNACVTAACTADLNIKTACSISNNGTRWSAWGANSKCGF